jgi:hypothetical protein
MSLFSAKALFISIFLAIFLAPHPAAAIPFGDIRLVYVANPNGTYTYYFRVKNLGPTLSPDVRTPTDHLIFDWSSQLPVAYAAGNKPLDDDANIVLFGIDTLRDDVTVTQVTNAGSKFIGSIEAGFSDTDGDSIPNTVIAWHLPFTFTLGDTIQPQKALYLFSFTLNQELTQLQYWVGGSDDTVIWNSAHIMVEDEYGIYDATDGAYLATFITKETQPARRNASSPAQILHQLK